MGKGGRALYVCLAGAALVYMALEAHTEAGKVSSHNGFGSDFEGTIWNPGRAVLDGVSPYPAAAQGSIAPSVYLPPIFVAASPLAWLPVHVATWVWFAVLFAVALAVPALVGVRDPFCYALWMLSLPVVDSLMLGNSSLLIALGCALVWRYRDRPTAAAIAAAGVVVLKFWIWPLLVWLLITRPRSGIRAVAIAGSATIVAWAVIGFRGLTAYPGLMHTEAQRFARIGVLFVASLIQLDVPIKLAAAAGVVAGVALLGAAYSRRANDLDSFALALLAALVATPVAWPHYLVLPALTLMIARPALSLAWAWFPGLWLAFDLGQQHGLAGQPLALSLFAVLPAHPRALLRTARRRHTWQNTNGTPRVLVSGGGRIRTSVG